MSFFKIFQLFFSSFFSILRQKKLRNRVLLPYGIGTLVFLFLIISGFTLSDNIIGLFLDTEKNWLITTLSWGLAIINILFSAIIAVLVITIAGSFAFESFVEEALKQENLLDQHFERTSGVRPIIRSLFSDVLWIIFLICISILVFAAGFFPVASIISFLLAALIAGINLLDLPLSILKIPFRKRVGLLFRSPLSVLSLGACYSVLLFIPFGGILFLPVGYLVAVRGILKELQLKDKI